MPKKNFVSLVELQKAKVNDIVPIKEKGVGGRPEGSTENLREITSKTREEAKKKFVKRGRKNLDKLFNALLSTAIGLQYLYRKDKKTGFFVKVTDEQEICAFLDARYGKDKLDKDKVEKYEGYCITVEKPNVKALTDLLDRFVGKAINFDEMPESINDIKKKEISPQQEEFKVIEAEIFAKFKTTIKKNIVIAKSNVIDIKKQG